MFCFSLFSGLYYRAKIRFLFLFGKLKAVGFCLTMCTSSLQCFIPFNHLVPTTLIWTLYNPCEGCARGAQGVLNLFVWLWSCKDVEMYGWLVVLCKCRMGSVWVAHEQPNEIYVQLCCKDSEKKPYSIPESLGMKQDKNVLSLQTQCNRLGQMEKTCCKT